MVSSQAKTVKEYLNELPAGRRESIETIRNLILEHLPEGYVETMRWGMISYEVPIEVFPGTYNKQPLNYVGLAAQKHYNSLYLMSIYIDPKQLEMVLQAYTQAGRKPAMGKSCLHFKEAGDLPMEMIGNIIAATPMNTYITNYLSSRQLKT